MRIELHQGDLLRIDLRPGEAADTVALADLVYLVVDADGRPLALDFVAADAFLPFLRARGGVLEIPEYVDPDTDDATDAPLRGGDRGASQSRTA
ncbi:MAG TPA: hypothetical protein VGR16_08270 [Thermomicrobiales bacterium]|nr:hypothetical protein [Thermomicrobiales bacterium]